MELELVDQDLQLGFRLSVAGQHEFAAVGGREMNCRIIWMVQISREHGPSVTYKTIGQECADEIWASIRRSFDERRVGMARSALRFFEGFFDSDAGWM